MNDYRYQYDNSKPRKKFICPSCGKKGVFTRYIDSQTRDYIPERYGICDRANSCDYSLNPYKDGYSKKIWESEAENKKFVLGPAYSTSTTLKTNFEYHLTEKHPAFIPLEVLKDTVKEYRGNEFVNGLVTMFGQTITSQQLSLYHIGSSNLSWPGATTFPFIDIKHNVRAIQVKKFDEKMHTVKYSNYSGENRSCTGWLHSEIEYNYNKSSKQLPEWIQSYSNNDSKVSCLFGEHLLNLEGNKSKPVAIVEAPKTAIIANVYFRQILKERNFIWIAAGALGYLNREKCQVLKDRNVSLFPDLNAFEKWSLKAKEFSDIANFTVSDLLERKATAEEKEQGLDLADYLIKIPYRNGAVAKEIQPLFKLKTSDIISIQTETHTGKTFNDVIIVFIKTKKGNFDILFNAAGEFLDKYGDPETFRELSVFYNKQFGPVKFDQSNTWGQVVIDAPQCLL